MFASSGYFKGVNCPYYASGLCERSYCHFRHVRNDVQVKRNAVNSNSHVNALQTGIGGVESVKRNGLGGQPSLLGMVGNAIKQVQRDIEKDKAVIQHLQPNSKPGIPNYSPTPIDPPGVKTTTQKKQPVSATYLPPGIPAYKPTPIHLLQKKKPTVKSHIEYDPLSNSSLSERITLADAEQKIAAKQEPGKVIKKEKTGVDEEEIEARFSSDDEGLHDNANSTDAKSNIDKEETTKKDNATDSKVINEQQKNDKKESMIDCVNIKKEKIDSGFECDKGLEPLKKEAVELIQEVSKEEKQITLDKNKCDTHPEGLIAQRPTEQVSKQDEGSIDIPDTERLKNQDQTENDGHLGDEKERKSKEDERKKDRDSHKSGKHRSSRDLSHHQRHSEENHRHKSSEKARDKRHRHDSHSSSSRHKHSRSSKHGHVDKKLGDHHKSKEDHHRIKDHSRRHRHKKSAKSYSKSHHSRKKSKSAHKYRKSDRHHHHHHHHHHRRQSLSKSSSSKRKRRHSSLSGYSSYSSISSFSSSSSSGSSSDWSDSFTSSQLSEESHLSPTHKHRRSLSSSGSCPDKKVITSSQHLESSKSLLSSDKTNVFEKFQRTVSCVDLFGEDSSESDSGKQVIAKRQDSESSKDVILLSDDENDGDGDGSGEDDDMSGNNFKMDTSTGNKEETGKCLPAGMKRKHEENDNDNKDTREVKADDVHPETEDGSLPIMKKRRLAHAANPDALIKRQVPPIAPHRPSPAQVMLNRFKEIQKAREAAEPEPETSGSNKDKPTPVSDLSEKKRIAHSVQDLKQGQSLMKNRPSAAKLTLNRISNNIQPNVHSTKAGTIAKGSSRQAHVPNQKMLKRPIIPADGGSKVATSIRQRYLNLFVDECVKIYPQAKDAYDRALLEEKSVCARASNKKIYLNVAINTLKKLRDEVVRSSDSSDQELKSPTKNPLALSHAAVLDGARAANTKFTLKRSGGQIKLPAHLTSRQLYILLSRYILTEDQLVENGFPRPVPGEPGKAKLQTPDRMKHMPLNSTEKNCTRCGKRFFVSVDGVYVTQENCVYHWGKCWKRRIAGSLENRYTCCQGDTESPGCQLSPFHVHEQNKYKDLTGYVQTRPISPPPDGDYKLYAMDCEMVYTRGGCELARVTVIDTNLQSVYEAVVRPEYEVIDYNTRFSGLTADDMKGVTTTLNDVQTKLLSMVNDKTILIGHSLESDFIALKLLHKTVVDTSVVFPHKLGPPYKRALRTLMAEILQKIIQNDVGGHDSKEDAAACMELMIWKAKDDAKKALRS